MAAESGGHDSGAVVEETRPSLAEFLEQRGLAKYTSKLAADGIDLEAFVLLQDEDMKKWAPASSQHALLTKA